MANFSDVLDKIHDGILDMSSLEVVNYKGTINIEAGDAPGGFKFDDILEKAKSQVDFKITACTLVELDGDMKVFYDSEITQPEIKAHHEMVDIARNNRQAVVDLFKDAILKFTD